MNRKQIMVVMFTMIMAMIMAMVVMMIFNVVFQVIMMMWVAWYMNKIIHKMNEHSLWWMTPQIDAYLIITNYY